MSFNWPHPDMQEEYESGFYKTGATEPWIAQILYSLIVAKQEPVTIIETGGYVGTTSAWLAKAAQEVGGVVVVCEVDQGRAEAIEKRLTRYDSDNREWHQPSNWVVRHGDARDILDEQPDGSLGFAWVDEDGLPDGGRDYVAGHAGIYRRSVLEKTSWQDVLDKALSMQDEGLNALFYDTWGTHLMVDAGATLCYSEYGSPIAVVDIDHFLDPRAEPWR